MQELQKKYSHKCFLNCFDYVVSRKNYYILQFYLNVLFMLYDFLYFFARNILTLILIVYWCDLCLCQHYLIIRTRICWFWGNKLKSIYIVPPFSNYNCVYTLLRIYSVYIMYIYLFLFLTYAGAHIWIFKLGQNVS